MEATTDRSVLEGKLIPELQKIASGMGIEGAQKLRKSGLIDAIVAAGNGSAVATPVTTPAAPAEGTSVNGDADGDEGARDAAAGAPPPQTRATATDRGLEAPPPT